MRQVTARYFFRLKYHQGFHDACVAMDKALRQVKVSPHARNVIAAVRLWSEKELAAWDASPDKKDWRNDKPPACPVDFILAHARAIKNPEKAQVAPFLEEGFESTVDFLGDFGEEG